LEDLSAINYSLQGLAEKKPKTQETVLVKRIKYRVRSIKGCWLVLDAGIKTQEIDLGIMAFLRGLCVKPPLHLLPSIEQRTGRGLPTAALVANGAGAPGDEKLD
jgi:hypothetical protein